MAAANHAFEAILARLFEELNLRGPNLRIGNRSGRVAEASVNDDMRIASQGGTESDLAVALFRFVNSFTCPIQ